MKKLIVILLLVVIIFTLAACGNASLVGRWEVTRIVAVASGGLESAVQNAIASGTLTYTYQFFRDGRLSITMRTTHANGSHTTEVVWMNWSRDGDILQTWDPNMAGSVRSASYQISGLRLLGRQQLVIRPSIGESFYFRRLP